MDRAEEEEEKIILQYLEIRQIYEQERKTKPKKQMRKETKTVRQKGLSRGKTSE